jgi:hypothetical protein
MYCEPELSARRVCFVAGSDALRLCSSKRDDTANKYF